MAMKKTYWLIWNKQIKIPNWIDSLFIDTYFAEEKKQETIIKKELKKDEEKVESIKLKTFLDDKRNQMLSIMLSRFPYTVDDLYKVLVKFDYDVFEESKNKYKINYFNKNRGNRSNTKFNSNKRRRICTYKFQWKIKRIGEVK